MAETADFYYEVDTDEQLSTEVVTAVAQAHDENIIDQMWRISDDINTDALDSLFQEHNLDMSLQFEADTVTVTITADKNGNPVININSHR